MSNNDTNTNTLFIRGYTSDGLSPMYIERDTDGTWIWFGNLDGWAGGFLSPEAAAAGFTRSQGQTIVRLVAEASL